ncbi:MAG: hypothetical protein ACI9SQ_000828, partial [Rubritalea sp.]
KNSHLTGGNVTTTPLNFSEFWIPMLSGVIAKAITGSSYLSPISFAALSNNAIKLSIQYNCEDGITPSRLLK